MSSSNTTAGVAAENDAVAILDAAGDGWAAEARRRRWTVQSEHDEHRRDRVTVAGHVLYRVEDTGSWHQVQTAGDNQHLSRPVRLSELARVGGQHAERNATTDPEQRA